MLQIVSQTHRGRYFNDRISVYNSSVYTNTCADGGTYKLTSSEYPTWIEDRMKLYVRGTNPRRDRLIIAVPKYMTQVLNTILAYNQKHTKNKLDIEDVAEELKDYEGFEVISATSVLEEEEEGFDNEEDEEDE